MRRRSPAEDDEICQGPGRPCWCWPCVERFIADHGDGASLAEVGAQLGLVRQRIDQIEKVAFGKLLGPLRRLREG